MTVTIGTVTMTEAQAEQILETFGTLGELNREADSLKASWEDLAERAKEKKKAWENKLAEIQKAIRRAQEPEPPLFAQANGQATATVDGSDDDGGTPPPADDVIDVEFATALDGSPALGIGGPTADPDADPPKQSPEGDAWRGVRLDTLADPAIPAKVLGHLAEAGLHTIGDVQAWEAQHKALTDVDGIGEKGADKILEALDGFWARWNRGDTSDAKPAA